MASSVRDRRNRLASMPCEVVTLLVIIPCCLQPKVSNCVLFTVHIIQRRLPKVRSVQRDGSPMLPKACMMLAKSCFILKSMTNWMLQRHPGVPSVFVVFIIALIIIGCENTTSNEQTRYRWETVMEGDWSSHLYDVHFISEKQGWAVGNAVDVIPGADLEKVPKASSSIQVMVDKHGTGRTAVFSINLCEMCIFIPH